MLESSHFALQVFFVEAPQNLSRDFFSLLLLSVKSHVNLEQTPALQYPRAPPGIEHSTDVEAKKPSSSQQTAFPELGLHSLNGTGVLVVVVVAAVVVVLVVAMVVVVVGSGMQDPDEHLPRAPFFVQIAPSGNGNVPPH